MSYFFQPFPVKLRFFPTTANRPPPFGIPPHGFREPSAGLNRPAAAATRTRIPRTIHPLRYIHTCGKHPSPPPNRSCPNNTTLRRAGHPLRCLDAAVIDKAPFLAIVVNNFPGVINAGFMRLARRCTKQRSHRPGGLLPGDAGHLDLAAKFLVAEVKGQGPHLRSVRHPPPPACGRWLPPQ